MAALPPPLDSRNASGRAAGIGAMGSASWSLSVCLLFIAVIGADRGQ